MTSSISYSQYSASPKNIDFGVVLSLKSGYHSSYKEALSEGFSGGLIFDGSAEFPVAKGWFAGFDAQYWNETNDKYPETGGAAYPKEFSGFEFAFGIRTRSKPNPFSILFGLYIGNYSISSSSVIGKDTDNYLSFTFSLGSEFYFSKSFALGTDASYKALANFDKGAGFWIIKIGPSFNFN